MDNDRELPIHFYECYDETLWLYESEIKEWLDEIQKILNSKQLSPRRRLQKIVDSIIRE